jgi:hypothetical protein
MKSSLFVSGCLAIGLVTSAPAAVTDGLVHHWNFDEGPDWHDSPFQMVCTNTWAVPTGFPVANSRRLRLMA